LPVLSVPSFPARKRSPLARTAGEKGRLAASGVTRNSGSLRAVEQPTIEAPATIAMRARCKMYCMVALS
jgi:hypothetical protein